MPSRLEPIRFEDRLAHLVGGSRIRRGFEVHELTLTQVFLCDLFDPATTYGSGSFVFLLGSGRRY